MHSEIAFVDREFWPNRGEKLFLADHFAGSGDQRDQQIERSGADPDWLIVPRQPPARWLKPETSELD